VPRERGSGAVGSVRPVVSCAVTMSARRTAKKKRRGGRQSITGNLLRMSIAGLEEELATSLESLKHSDLTSTIAAVSSNAQDAEDAPGIADTEPPTVGEHEEKALPGPHDGNEPAPVDDHGLDKSTALSHIDVETLERKDDDPPEEPESDHGHDAPSTVPTPALPEKAPSPDTDAVGNMGSSLQRYRRMLPTAIRSIACGDRMTLVLSAEGNVFQFGTLRSRYIKPTKVHLEHQEGIQIAVASCGSRANVEQDDHMAVIVNRDTRNLFMWGSNDFGQLGVASREFHQSPVSVKDLAERVAQVTLGPKYTICVTEENHVYGFGINIQGELGLGKKIEVYKGSVDDGDTKTTWATDLSDKDRPSRLPTLSFVGDKQGVARIEEDDASPFGPRVFGYDETDGHSFFLKRMVHAGKGFNLSWTAQVPCNQIEEDMHATIENMRGDLEEMAMVIEDKKVEMEMLKPPQEQIDSVRLAAARAKHNNEKSILVSLVGAPGNDGPERTAYNQVRRDPLILATVKLIASLEEEQAGCNEQEKVFKTKMSRVEQRIHDLGTRMELKGENEKTLWRLIEQMPSRLNRFNGPSEGIPEITRQNIDALKDDKLALLKGGEEELGRMRLEMSALVKTYHGLQNTEAAAFRKIAGIERQIGTLTALGRSHANTLQRALGYRTEYDCIDVAHEMNAFSDRIDAAARASEKTLIDCSAERVADTRGRTDRGDEQENILSEMHHAIRAWEYATDLELWASAIGSFDGIGDKKAGDEPNQHMVTSQAYAQACEEVLKDTVELQKSIDTLQHTIVERTRQKSRAALLNERQTLFGAVAAKGVDRHDASPGNMMGGCFGGRA
jgi:hypothetical protein